MASLQNIADKVKLITGRIDQTVLIEAATKAIVTKAHTLDLFKRDLAVSGVVAIGVPAQEVTITPLPERLRDFAYIALTDVAGTPLGTSKYLAVVSDLIQLKDNTEFTGDIKYCIVGDSLKIYSPFGSVNYIQYGYYQYPDVSSMALSTWLTNNALAEQAIVDGVTFYVKQKLRDVAGQRVERDLWTMWQQDILALNLDI